MSTLIVFDTCVCLEKMARSQNRTLNSIINNNNHDKKKKTNKKNKKNL